MERRWARWRRHFEANRTRPLPDPGATPDPLPPALARALARSLARFELGETGEGRIAHQIDGVRLDSIDADYRAALKLFVREEGKHGRILRRCLASLGGQPIRHTWTETLFRRGRRLLGVRLKLLVLLAAEVVSLVFYGALAGRLPPGPVRRALEDILADERAHLRFHAAFFRAEARTPARRLAFAVAWRLVAGSACLVVLADHASTLRRLGAPLGGVAAAIAASIGTVGRCVTSRPGPGSHAGAVAETAARRPASQAA